MPTEFRRKLYKRGSSFETTIPMPLLFALDKSKKQNVLFKFDNQKSKWYIEFEEDKTADDKLDSGKSAASADAPNNDVPRSGKKR